MCSSDLNTCDDRDDLRDVLAECRWGSWATDPVDNVLDCHYDGIGLCFEIWLEAEKIS